MILGDKHKRVVMVSCNFSMKIALYLMLRSYLFQPHWDSVHSPACGIWGPLQNQQFNINRQMKRVVRLNIHLFHSTVYWVLNNAGSHFFRDPSDQTVGASVSFTIETNEVPLVEWTTIQVTRNKDDSGWSIFNGKIYRRTRSLIRRTTKQV